MLTNSYKAALEVAAPLANIEPDEKFVMPSLETVRSDENQAGFE